MRPVFLFVKGYTVVGFESYTVNGRIDYVYSDPDGEGAFLVTENKQRPTLIRNRPIFNYRKLVDEQKFQNRKINSRRNHSS